jgi:hypothetical protein
MPLALAGLACLVGATLGHAVEADPNKTYYITPDVGAWVICAASYTGPEAAQKAHDLVLEIRRRYNLPAFIFSRGDKERREQEAEQARMKQLCPEGHFRTVRIEEQYAVLIGGYKDIDSARKALTDVKKIKLTDKDKHLMSVLFAGDAQTPTDTKASISGAGYYNPLWDSFVAPNPTVAHERKVENKVDPLMKELNADESLSLLKCKQPWTLAVATFQGASVIQSESAGTSFLNKIVGRGAADTLSASAMNAHNFAEVLRKAHFDAYVLHLSKGSLVTVGGFASKDDPQIREVEQRLASQRFAGRIELLPQAFAMPVPRP